MEPVVELKNLTHVYVNDREASLAVEGLNLTVHPGEFISLVGPSGCGKTTILSMIAGLLHPTNGEVLVYGRKVEGPSPDVGYMLQQDYLFPWRTILQNAAIGLEVTGRLQRESMDHLTQLLGEMGLEGTGSLYPQQLSGGMRQRVALVRTLSTDPGLLLLDEPFSALDYQTKLQLEDLIAGTLREKNKTAILVTHDLSEAVAVSDRVVLLGKNPGRIRRTFEVPGHIRETQPFYARKEEGFNELFHEIWREMESEED
ncbi:ABC transporter ATP-binding protein [Paenibacillus cellulositrophicus]|uniref:ABC transporter ATP-binding protein n=1 Tax=Paenibacillus cellulositrophicus TaxID=562959 RepID=UPI00126709B6|nr:ABC transporter ATP-binding protein [Paenibacillus cellulositrophicus]